jgi:ArsR family transcriptional regulator
LATLELFKALSDEVRLRIVRALSAAELSVAELVGALRLPQSTVSRHLKPLRDAGLVSARREGTSVYYHPGPAAAEPGMNEMLEQHLGDVPYADEDLRSVRRMLEARRRRSRVFFDRVAGGYETLTQPGGGWPALAAGLAAGFAGKDVADLGAGEGALALLLARFARSVTAVDHSPRMLRALRERARAAGCEAVIRPVEGDVEALPLEDGSVDAAFLSQALHHAARPARAVAEAARVLRSGGRLVVLDLVRHDQEWVREQWADQWLGFDAAEIETWMKAAGLSPRVVEQLPGSSPELAVLLAVAERSG